MASEDKAFHTLILFFSFLVLKKIIDIYIITVLPTYDVLKRESIFWKIFVKIRNLFSLITLIFGITILYTLKLNTFLYTLFIMIILSNLFYFLFDYKWIYVFFNKSPDLERFRYLMNKYVDNVFSVILAIYAVYTYIYINYKT
jgi:hypothetical protein